MAVNDGISKQQSLHFTVKGTGTVSSQSPDAQKVIALAKTQVGQPISTYWKWYNGTNKKVNGCALFVSYVACKADLEKNVIPTQAYVPSHFYIDKGLYHKSQSRDGSYVPKPGDLIFYDWGL